jgi:hypothetical protein
VRSPPAPFSREPAAGQPWHVRRWLRQRGSASRATPGWCGWAGQRSPVRLVAATLAPTATRRARRRGRVVVAHHHAGRGHLVDGGRAVWVWRQVASGTEVEKNEATAAAHPDPQPAPHACRSARPGAADGLGLAGKHDDVAACPVVCHRVPRERRGEGLVVERAGTGDAAAAGAGQVVGGPSPGVPPSCAPLSMPSSTTSGTSGIRGAHLAGTARWCTPGQTAKGGLKKA